MLPFFRRPRVGSPAEALRWLRLRLTRRCAIATACIAFVLLAAILVYEPFAERPPVIIPLPTAEELSVLHARLPVAPRLSGAAPLETLAALGAATAWRARLASLRTLGVPSYWDETNAAHVILIEAFIHRAHDNTLIVMYGTGGLENLMMNAICHWARLQMNNYVIFSSGRALRSLRAHPLIFGSPNIAVVDVNDVLGSVLIGVDLDTYHDFFSDAFRVQTRIKFLLAELMVQIGLHVVIQDTDVIVQRDFRPHMLALACGAVDDARYLHEPGAPPPRSAKSGTPADNAATVCGTADYTQAAERGELFGLDAAPFIYFQTEMPAGVDYADKEYCNHNTGFFFLRASYFSVFAMRHMIRVIEHDIKRSEQRIFGEFIKGWGPLLSKRVGQLPFDLYPSGYYWRENPSAENHAFIVHANWILGLEDKTEKLLRAGLLLWDGASGVCWSA